MDSNQLSEILCMVALKKVPPDIVISNATVFNSITGEFLKAQSIWIKDGWIAYVGPERDPVIGDNTQVIDAQEKVILPGLIEGHTHIMNLTGLEEFVRHVIPSGTTTVITETIELATVAGIDGFKYFINAMRNQPIRFYHTIAPLCGLTSQEEIHAPRAEAYRQFFRDPQCLGLGEVYWANMFLEGEQGERVRDLAAMARSYGKLVEGHTAGASDNKLQAYTALGVSSCHEPITEKEVVERLRLGYWVMIRQGGIRKELDEVAGVFKKGIDTRRIILCTDSMDPEGFISEGYLDAAVRHAIKLGIRPAQVYQAVTINVAEHFGLDRMIGSITPGKQADLVMIPSAEKYLPELVMCRGKVIYRDGKALDRPREESYPRHMFDTVKIDSFSIPSFPKKGKARVMELVSRLVTKEGVVNIGNKADWKDVNLLLALERTGSGGTFLGLIKGFGLREGACGSTMCWDTPDMIVIGRDIESMKMVVERLRELGGGAVVATKAQVVAEYPAPLCGVVTLDSMETARNRLQHLEESLKRLGVPWEKPLLTLNTLGTAAIPHLRITHHGYVRLRDRAVLPLEI